MGSTEEMAVPKTKDNIVSLYLDHCSLDHEGICNVHSPFAELVQEAKWGTILGLII